MEYDSIKVKLVQVQVQAQIHRWLVNAREMD